MHRCLELALRGQGKVAPNPMVGCVIVHAEEIISEGWHARYGQNHAERNAILAIENDARLAESTLYVNLEPCAHHGKTPPCADLIIASGIKKVVIGSPDPFEEVNGKGVDKLRKAGVEVIENILRKECDHLNQRFLHFHRNKKPFIVLKWAETADGFLASENKIKKQISGEQAKILLHKWRSEESGIMVGAGTVASDKPRLDVRFWQGENPQRFVLDGNLRNQYPYDEYPVSVFNYIRNENTDQVNYIQVPKENNIPFIINNFYENKILSVLVEGGKEVLEQFIAADLYDEIRIIQSKNVLFGSGMKAPQLHLEPNEIIALDTDIIKIYRRPNP